MAIIGWLFLVAISVYAVILTTLITWNGFGQYNIGGVPNTFGGKILILLGWVCLGAWWWYVIIGYAPFTMEIK